MKPLLLVTDTPVQGHVIAEDIRRQLNYTIRVVPLSSLYNNMVRLEDSIDVAILDVSVCAYHELKTHFDTIRSHIPGALLVLLYPVENNDIEAGAAALGIDDIIARPMSIARLKITLQNLLRMHALQVLAHQAKFPKVENRDHGYSSKQLSLLNSQGEVRQLRLIEAEAITFALEYYHGRITKVARALGLGRSTLYRKIDELGLHLSKSSPALKAPLLYNSRANQTTRPMIQVSATGRS